MRFGAGGNISFNASQVKHLYVVKSYIIAAVDQKVEEERSISRQISIYLRNDCFLQEFRLSVQMLFGGFNAIACGV